MEEANSTIKYTNDIAEFKFKDVTDVAIKSDNLM